ncbi:hypothetical protein WICMUC_005274 [Wickerhamomyces mucosus]|uniref:Uncharacterized protein n=1 Tax=Wickerhamomyces mucosus TaxID=1378264 RepID=A0A9P8P995_9ASCO|nr:hypothetical protein WICMUC_005274 [Wickerhamomyces mucosus]
MGQKSHCKTILTQSKDNSLEQRLVEMVSNLSKTLKTFSVGLFDQTNVRNLRKTSPNIQYLTDEKLKICDRGKDSFDHLLRARVEALEARKVIYRSIIPSLNSGLSKKPKTKKTMLKLNNSNRKVKFNSFNLSELDVDNKRNIVMSSPLRRAAKCFVSVLQKDVNKKYSKTYYQALVDFFELELISSYFTGKAERDKTPSDSSFEIDIHSIFRNTMQSIFTHFNQIDVDIKSEKTANNKLNERKSTERFRDIKISVTNDGVTITVKSYQGGYHEGNRKVPTEKDKMSLEAMDIALDECIICEYYHVFGKLPLQFIKSYDKRCTTSGGGTGEGRSLIKNRGKNKL